MAGNGSGKQPHVLLVEDNPADAWIIRDSLSKTGLTHQLTVIEDGEDASEFLEERARLGWSKVPDLMLLDLNLPRKSGIEILTDVKSNPLLRKLPVLILSSSGADNDVERAYLIGANQYFRKPVELAGFEDLMSMIVKSWLSTACLPSRTACQQN